MINYFFILRITGMKKKTAIIVSISLFIVIILIGALLFLTINKEEELIEDDEKKIKDLILEDISNYNNRSINNANVTFEKINITSNSADVDIFVEWGPWNCGGYNYKLSKSNATWKITSRVQTIEC
jgi:hypothetical protein